MESRHAAARPASQGRVRVSGLLFPRPGLVAVPASLCFCSEGQPFLPLGLENPHLTLSLYLLLPWLADPRG